MDHIVLIQFFVLEEIPESFYRHARLHDITHVSTCLQSSHVFSYAQTVPTAMQCNVKRLMT